MKSTSPALLTGLLLVVFATGFRVVHCRAEEIWPGFRGRGDSVSAAKSLPLSWELRDRGAGWTVRLPGYGQSSPVVWKGRVFTTAVSGDNKEQLHVVAVDLAKGDRLWQKDFAGTQAVRDSDTVSRGAPTPTVDADRLYAVFESGDVVALSHTGETLWQRSFVKDYGEIKGPHGYASSPLLVDDLLVIQVCHGGPSYLLALDKATGQNRWKVDHPSQTGWSSPVAHRSGETSAIIVSSAGSVRAFDAKDGREIWSVAEVQGNSTPSATISDGLVVIGASSEMGGGGARRSGGETPRTEGTRPVEGVRPPGGFGGDPAQRGSLVIRLGGSGDVTGTHVVWKSPKVQSGYASPVVLDGFAYFVNRAGVAQCVELQSGEIKWQERLPGQMWASPVANNGHLIFFCKEGTVAVAKAGPAQPEFVESTLSATDIIYGVAAVDGAWIVRAGRSLTKIAGTAAVSAESTGSN